MSVSLLAGCGSEGDNQPSGSNEGEQNSGQEDGSEGNSQSSGSNEGEQNGGEEANATPFYMTLDPQVSGDIDIMTWGGDSVYHADLGHQEISDMELDNYTVAMIYAMAKKFNEMYPNVKVNLYAVASGGENWDQELENFKAEHAKYPDIYSSMALPKDVAKGMVADMSIYANDPLYQSFNSSVMEMMNYYGVQAGIPYFMIPWGVWVNKELAETKNVPCPDPDWTIDEYTDFVTSADKQTFWGLMWGGEDYASKFIGTGVDTVNAALKEGKEIDLASDQVMRLLDYVPKWSSVEVWAKWNEGAIDVSIMDAGDWGAWHFFCKNFLLTCSGEPWFLRTACQSQNEDGTWPENAVQATDWDIYPRPSTDYRGNNIGIITDPLVMHNYAMDDGDPALSDAEKAKLDLTYAFTSYWCGATEAMQARADQMYNNYGTLHSSLTDSFPLVTGEEFDRQMAIWYSVGGRSRYADENRMPGFQYVLKLWEEGAIYDYSDKCYPCKIMEDGMEIHCLDEWNRMTYNDVSGLLENDPNWLDTIKANLPEWNTKSKERLAKAQEELQTGLKTYYGLTDSDF
ncbi:MAG: extracellular solute-binding protein [Lachnospiraceae bacterium]|nr:extracellular solute-binding protein [Lachnospiraceae bacterium]